MDPRDSLDIARQAEEDRKAQERAAEEAAAAQALIDMRLGPAADDTEFQQRISDTQPYFARGSTKRERRERLTDYEDALRQGRAMYDPQANLSPGQYTQQMAQNAPRGGQSAIDPRVLMRRDGILPPLSPGGLPQQPDLEALNALFPTGDDPAGTDTDDGPPGGPAAPRGPSIYDMERGLLERTLGSQLEGFGEQRDLVAQLADLREQGIADQQQFAEDRATGREEFLEETDIRRAEQEEAARVERENRKTAELARQQTQLDDALAAVGVDKNLAGQRLQSLGIDPGGFADADMSETTAMLYSQNMSAANMVNQLDGVAEQAAMFAKSQNDQASAAAMFGISEDLSYAIQAFDQARLQGQIDDAQALQGIADAERAARESFDTALTTLDVNTKKAAQAAAAAAAARARKEAKEQEMLAAGVIGLQAIEKARAGQPLTTEEYMAIQMSSQGDELLSAGASFIDAADAERLREEDIRLEGLRAARDEDYAVAADLRRGYGTLNEAGEYVPTPAAASQSNKIPVPLATGQVGYFSPGELISIAEYNQTYNTGFNPAELMQFLAVAQLPEGQG